MPIVSQLKVDKALSNISVQYKNADYVADQMIPTIPVNDESGKFYVYNRNFRLPETIRRDGAEANQHQFAVSISSYQTVEHALKDVVTDRAAKNYGLASLKTDTVEELTDKIMLRKEKAVADLFTTTSFSLNVSLAAAGQWTLDTLSSNPILLMDTAGSTVLANSGFLPNFAFMERKVMLAAKNHTTVIGERVKYTSAEITKKTLAALFEMPEILVGMAQVDAAAEGLTDNIGDVWPDHILVAYKATRPSVKSPSMGYFFVDEKRQVRTWRNEARKGEEIEVGESYVPKIVASLAAYLIKDVRG